MKRASKPGSGLMANEWHRARLRAGTPFPYKPWVAVVGQLQVAPTKALWLLFACIYSNQTPPRDACESQNGALSMPLTREQAHAIARLVHALRPDWDEPGVLAALKPLAKRHAPDVALAAVRAATDPEARTPGVIPTDGPHWREQLASQARRDPAHATVPFDEACVTCGRSEDACRMTPRIDSDDHRFESRRNAAIRRARQQRRDNTRPAAELCHDHGVARTRCGCAKRPPTDPRERAKRAHKWANDIRTQLGWQRNHHDTNDHQEATQ